MKFRTRMVTSGYSTHKWECGASHSKLALENLHHIIGSWVRCVIWDAWFSASSHVMGIPCHGGSKSPMTGSNPRKELKTKYQDRHLLDHL